MGNSNVDLDKLELLLIAHEGKRINWYKDTKGLWTIGVGHLATKADDLAIPWTKDQIEAQFKKDVNIAIASLSVKLPWFEDLDGVRKAALIDMCFNMGINRLLGFGHMLAALKANDWVKAKAEALNSKWAKEDVQESRVTDITTMLKDGVWPSWIGNQ